MELAERIEEKRPSLIKSDTIESSLTNASKAQRNTKIRTFVILASTGILLVLGGSLIFIYRDMSIASKSPSAQSQVSRHKQNSVEHSTTYQGTLSIVAFAIIGVGIVLFVIGGPAATLYFLRQHVLKDSERSPILKKPATADTNERDSLSKKRKHKKRPASWRKNTTRTLSREGFRFAAHRHPSLNHISIDGSRFSFRRFSEHSSSNSSDENLPTISGSPARRIETLSSVGEFFRNLFRRKEVNHEEDSSKVSRAPPEAQESDLQFMSTRDSDIDEHYRTDIKSNTTHSGLYNLEQE